MVNWLWAKLNFSLGRSVTDVGHSDTICILYIVMIRNRRMGGFHLFYSMKGQITTGRECQPVTDHEH